LLITDPSTLQSGQQDRR